MDIRIQRMLLCRSHKDLVKDAAPHYKKARKFYDSLAAQLVQQGHALDVFACSLDQVSCSLQSAVMLRHKPKKAFAICSVLHTTECIQS